VPDVGAGGDGGGRSSESLHPAAISEKETANTIARHLILNLMLFILHLSIQNVNVKNGFFELYEMV
jgi:hypothetical protein